MPEDLTDALFAELSAVTDAAGVTTEAADLEPSVTEWRGLYRGRTGLMLAPRTTGEAFSTRL